MATVYKFEVECVSAFCVYEPEFIQSLITAALKDYKNKDTGLTLESISVKQYKEPNVCSRNCILRKQ